jgi:2-phosphosulfolactate phosphatase
VTAVAGGGIIHPCAWSDDPAALAQRLGAEVAVSRPLVPERGRFSLSPPTMLGIEPGTAVVLASPNGATCSRYGRDVPVLLVGALVNARAVSEALAAILVASELNVTILACGERWKTVNEDGELRFAIEDYLGAGAIISGLPPTISRSPEAAVCEGAFRSAREDLAGLLRESGSGRELQQMGYPEDVEHAAHLDAYTAVPVMDDGRLVALPPAT